MRIKEISDLVNEMGKKNQLGFLEGIIVHSRPT